MEDLSAGTQSICPVVLATFGTPHRLPTVASKDYYHVIVAEKTCRDTLVNKLTVFDGTAQTNLRKYLGVFEKIEKSRNDEPAIVFYYLGIFRILFRSFRNKPHYSRTLQ